MGGKGLSLCMSTFSATQKADGPTLPSALTVVMAKLAS